MKLVVFLVYTYRVLGWEPKKCLRAQVFEKKAKNQSEKMVDLSQNFDVFMDETEINENEEMEIEFTPVETRKKTRSPSRTKTTPSVATTNHYDILSDEEEDPKEKVTEATGTQKKPRTKSKSPGRHHRSKSPKQSKEKKKKQGQ